MKKIEMKEKGFVVSLSNMLSDRDKLELFNFIDDCVAKGYSTSKTSHHCKVFVDIMLANPQTDHISLYNEYMCSKSSYHKLKIRFGSEAEKNYKKTLKQRRRPITKSHLQIQYWLDKGFDLETSRKKISSIQSSNSKKRHAKCPNYTNISPNSMGFWLSKGYDVYEAESLRLPFVEKGVHTLDNMIKRHGETKGLIKWKEKSNKRLSTMIARYGTTVVNGCVSRESLKFFVPLYKRLRRLGIQREDIFWGIKGSREFATRHEHKNYFYDFTIKSKKLIVEYNNSFWHPRDNSVFNNPFLSEEQALYKDNIKRKIMELKGYTIVLVWEDDDKASKIEEIVDMVTKR